MPINCRHMNIHDYPLSQPIRMSGPEQIRQAEMSLSDDKFASYVALMKRVQRVPYPHEMESRLRRCFERMGRRQVWC